MDDLVPRRHSYPRIENTQNPTVYDASAIDLHEITRESIEQVHPEITAYPLDRGAGPSNRELVQYSTFDFYRDVDIIQSKIDKLRRSIRSKSLTVD